MKSVIKTKINHWHRFYKFSEVFEYYGPIDESGISASKIISNWKGKKGPLHTDNGFRLRSLSNGSFRKTKLEESLSLCPCPLERGDIGCYWIRVSALNKNWDYIGKCGEKLNGIYKRLVDHLIKLSGTSKLRKQYKSTEKFSDLRKFLKKNNIDTSDAEFFKNCVQISFVKIKKSMKTPIAKQKVSTIEGMALAAYRNKNKKFPDLNSSDETIGLDGIEDLL